MLVASIALIAALGGSAVAVSRNSVGSRQIKNNSVQSVDVRDGTITAKDLAPGADDHGRVVAYASVSATGAVSPAESTAGLSSTNVTRTSNRYCFHGLPFAFAAATATPHYDDNEAGVAVSVEAQVDTAPLAIPADCPAGTQAEVVTRVNNAVDISGFVITFLS
jgi:hypothetical protein